MSLILLFLAGAAGLYLVADPSALFVGVDEVELTLRVLAAGALILHPIHEQRKGFRRVFNARVRGYDLLKADSRVIHYPSDFNVFNSPLSRTMNALQAAGLVTVFPALALWGPWWALAFAFSFYTYDRFYTHGLRQVPAGWSALVGAVALFSLLLSMDLPPLTVSTAAIVVAAVSSAAVTLFLPWRMAYSEVRS